MLRLHVITIQWTIILNLNNPIFHINMHRKTISIAIPNQVCTISKNAITKIITATVNQNKKIIIHSIGKRFVLPMEYIVETRLSMDLLAYN